MVKVLGLMLGIMLVWMIWTPSYLPESEEELTFVEGSVESLVKNIDQDREDQYYYVTVENPDYKATAVTSNPKILSNLRKNDWVEFGIWVSREGVPSIWAASKDGSILADFDDAYERHYDSWLSNKIRVMIFGTLCIIFSFFSKTKE